MSVIGTDLVGYLCASMRVDPIRTWIFTLFFSYYTFMKWIGLVKLKPLHVDNEVCILEPHIGLYRSNKYHMIVN